MSKERQRGQEKPQEKENPILVALRYDWVQSPVGILVPVSKQNRAKSNAS